MKVKLIYLHQLRQILHGLYTISQKRITAQGKYIKNIFVKNCKNIFINLEYILFLFI